jgi:hypothetical protein
MGSVLIGHYPVPTAYGHREVLVRGYVEPLHYLALLEQKIGALYQAAPSWMGAARRVPTLRRLLEARMGKAR